MDNLEKLVSDTILQKSSDVIVIDGVEYPITPPTAGTVIMISELVSQLPIVNRNTDNVLLEVLGTAKDMAIIGKIVATLILGVKRIKERRYKIITHSTEIKRWSWRTLRSEIDIKTSTKHILEIDYLAERILDELTNKTLVELVSKRLGLMQIGDFFELTTFLSEANHLKRTREVVVTASGE